MYPIYVLASPKPWLSSQRKALGTRLSEDAGPAFAICYSNSQTFQHHWGGESLSTFHFWKRVEKEYNKTEDQARPGCGRWSRRSEGQIPHRCADRTTVLMENPTGYLSLGFTPSCSRKRQCNWHLMIPKPSSGKADAIFSPPLYHNL